MFWLSYCILCITKCDVYSIFVSWFEYMLGTYYFIFYFVINTKIDLCIMRLPSHIISATVWIFCYTLKKKQNIWINRYNLVPRIRITHTTTVYTSISYIQGKPINFFVCYGKYTRKSMTILYYMNIWKKKKFSLNKFYLH